MMSGLEPPTDSAVSTASTPQFTTPTTPTPPASNLPTPPLQQPPGYPGAGRRTHRKSRTGCSRCKARKIKCDERHPACLNCISHGVECPFLRPGPTVNPVRAASKAASRSSVSPASGPTTHHDSPTTTLVDCAELPMLELELLHNFTTKTYTTLTTDSSVWSFWRDDVVQLGLTCDYIMRAVLAVSALHLASQRPDRRDFYVAEGILLHQKASRAAMQVMATEGDKIDKDQGASLFLFSMLTLFFALASPRRSNPDGTFFIGESGFPDWAFLISGSKSIMDVLGDRAKDTVAGPYLQYGAQRWHALRAKLAEQQQQQQQQPQQPQCHSPPTTTTTSKPQPEPLLAPLRARITAAVTSPSLLQTYTHALDELELALVASQDKDSPRDVLDAMVWLWTVSDDFVPLLRVPSQEAVAIFAHFCVLLKHHDSHWWLKGWGDHVMGRVREILDEEHAGWIGWPVREMGGMDVDGGSGGGGGSGGCE